MDTVNRYLRLLLDSFVKSLCWAVLAACVVWALGQWAPHFNPEQFPGNNPVITTESHYIILELQQ